MTKSAPTIAFVRLTEVPPAEVHALLNEPRNTRHLPLAGAFTAAETAQWIAAKDSQWDEFGYGPWAVLIDGEFAGWGGFQSEDDVADYALVLRPDFWGHGAAITTRALTVGFTDVGLDAVTIALPFSRNPDRVVARFGFVADGEASHGGVGFRRYRLTRDRWQLARPGSDASQPAIADRSTGSGLTTTT